MWPKIWEWLKKAWVWFKRNWKWALFPIGILVVLVSLFSRRRQTTVVVDDGHATDLAIKKHDEQVAAATAAAEAEAKAELEAIEKKHAAVIAELKDSQRLEFESLKTDPKALTAWLLALGKDKRKGRRR